MRLEEISKNDDKKIYQASISFGSRGNPRNGMSWSTKSTKEALRKMGYETIPWGLNNYPDLKDNAPIQEIKLSGTREEILAAREEITTRLRIMSGGKMAVKFKLLN